MPEIAKKIVVTGSNGQLGSELKKRENDFNYEMTFTDLPGIDLTDKKSVTDFVQDHRPEILINCAAYTAVDKAETERDAARKINVTAVEYLAQVCNSCRTTLIQLSTDFVFSGKSGTPLKEDDPTNPVNYYGLTKLEGEVAAIKNCDKTIIIRTAWLYSTYGQNFVKTMLRLAREKDSLNIIYDQVGCPTYAGDLADGILKIIAGLENGLYDINRVRGIYHFSNEGVASWYDFACAIFELHKIPVKVNPILTSDYPTPAQRPSFSVMDKSKIKKVFGIEIPYWKASLAKCLQSMR
jgi:dTDP-4-dehydrorhamnose reductase